MNASAARRVPMPSNQRLEITRGDTRRYQVTVTDEAGLPVNLSGASIYFTVRKKLASSVDDADAVFQKAVGTGITISDAAGGVIALVIDPADTRNFPKVVLLYDLQVITAAGDTITPAMGEFAINADVTRRAS
jgi:hypothetical protein